jgi:hypothetical protein
MLLVNNTPLPAAIVANAEEDRMVSLFVAAATFGIVGGRLVLDEAQLPLLLVAPPPAVGDAYHTKSGASVCAIGYAYAASGKARQSAVRLTVGEVERNILVFGTRVWRAGIGDLASTSPLPFDRVPMTWELAYGGSIWRNGSLIKLPSGEEAIVPGHDEACGLNFDGVGYYPERADAVDQPLPQLEDPEALIRSYKDRPDPVCFAPYALYGGMRARDVVQDRGLDFERRGRALSRAAPRTTFDELPPGTRVVLEGMRPSGAALAFTIPPAPITAEVRVGDVKQRLALHVDAVDIDAETSRVRIVYRALFAYALIQHEERNLRVEANALLASLLAPTG